MMTPDVWKVLEKVPIDSCEHLLIFDQDAGEEVCGKCGIVVTQKIEVLEFEEFYLKKLDGHITRASSPVETMTMYDNGLFSHMAKSDYQGKPLEFDPARVRLKRINRMSALSTSKLKNLNKAMRTLRTLASQLKMPESVAERSAYIYRKALKADLVRGRSILGIMGAATFIACREANMIVSSDDIQRVIDVMAGKSPTAATSRNEMIEYFKLISRELGIRPEVQNSNVFLAKIAQNCNIESELVIRRAAEMLSKAESHHLYQGKAPVTFAAAALFISALEHRRHVSQMMMANASGLTTVTLRKRINDLVTILDIKPAWIRSSTELLRPRATVKSGLDKALLIFEERAEIEEINQKVQE